MKSRIRQLKLNLLVQDEDRDVIGSIQEKVRLEFVVAVMESMERALHARFHPAVIIRVRELSVRWSLAQEQLMDPDYTRMLGEELAEQLVAQIVRQPEDRRLRPLATASVVLFENITHLRAARLSDEGETKAPAWFYDGFFREQDAWAQTCVAGAEEIKQVIAFLDRMGTLTPVLSRLDQSQVRNAIAVLPANEWPHASHRSMRASFFDAASPGETSVRTPSCLPPRLSYKSNPTPASGFTIERHFQLGLQERSTQSQSVPATASDSSKARRKEIESDAQDQRLIAREVEFGESEFGVGVSRPVVDGAVVREGSSDAENTRTPPTHAPNGKRDDDNRPAIVRSGGLVETEFGGLFYLLNPILELDLPEHLWCVGVKEGEFLCHLARLILGPEGVGDPAPRILGGIPGDRDPGLATLPAWAAAEVLAKSLKSLRTLLNRRQAPGHFTQNLETKIREGAAALVALPWETHRDFEPAIAVADCASVVLLAFGGRLGESLGREAILRMIRIPGWIQPGADEIRVLLPIDAIDTRIRRAGLDFSPGYLPWLKRKLVLAFE